MEARSRLRRLARISLVTIALVFEVGVLYILSYAPFLRNKYGADAKPDPSRWGVFVSYEFSEDDFIGSHTAFAPVEWLIDKEVLVKPLNAWARVCGVASQQEWRAHLRMLDGLDWPETWSQLEERSRTRKRLRSGEKSAAVSASR